MTRLVFFTGVGGAGTTTLAAATAVRAAREGARVLLLAVADAGELEVVLGTAPQEGLGRLLRRPTPRDSAAPCPSAGTTRGTRRILRTRSNGEPVIAPPAPARP